MSGILAAILAAEAGQTYDTRLSTTDKHPDLTVAASGLQANRTAAGNFWRTGRATVGRNQGKWYFEGRCTANATAGFLIIGLANSLAYLTEYLNFNDTSVGYLSSREVRNGYNVTAATAQVWNTPAAIVRIAVDLDVNRFYASIVGGDWNGRSYANPSADSGGVDLPAAMVGNEALIYPAYSIYQSGLGLVFNFGASPFAGSIPAGFAAWND